MATTRIIKHHISPGQTALESMKDRFDYALNPEKTQNGELVSAYMCDPATAHNEFALAKAKYKAVTGREQKKAEDVLCYQLRQAFVPGETDPETALKIGYDMAMRWTKGKHAFFVAVHTDRPHTHVHIYYNPISLDYTRKFRDFIGSARAVRRLSDRVCLENSLSVIANPKLHSKGKFKHYGAWLGGNKAPTFQEQLKAQIDICLAGKPKDFNAFLAAMQAAGYEVKQRRGAVSFRAEEQERYTRLRSSTLGKGYGQNDIQAVIEGRVSHSGGRVEAPRKVNLVIDIAEKMRAGKSPAYQRWSTVYNLKQMAAAVQYLQENDLIDYEALTKKAAESTDRFNALSATIKTTEAAMKRNKELSAAVVDYAKTRAVFSEYKAQKYSRKYLAGHEADIATYRAAQETFKRILDGAKLPKMDTLKTEGRELSATKKAAYAEYRDVRKDMQEAVTAKANIDSLFGIAAPAKNKEMER